MSPDRTFDWRPNPDDRRAAYPVQAILRGTGWTLPYRHWYVRGPVLDQGTEGACVGHGVTNGLMTSPVALALPNPQQTAFGMYYGSRYIDEWPGEDYDGTSVQAGGELARGLGLIGSYWWCTTVEDIITAILQHGPVVIGIVWQEAMYEAPGGVVVIGGGVVGGHCLLITGYSATRRSFRWRNSWGEEYGSRGNAWISVDDFRTLFAQQGEAAVLAR